MGKTEVSIIKLKNKKTGKETYKVTRRYADQSIADTEFFEDINEARKKIKDWSN